MTPVVHRKCCGNCIHFERVEGGPTWNGRCYVPRQGTPKPRENRAGQRVHDGEWCYKHRKAR